MVKKALILPPQMTIRTGHLVDYYEQFEEVQQYFAKASEILGINLYESFFSENEKLINESYIGRCGIVSITCGLLKRLNIDLNEYSFVSGPSLGSITSGYISGAYSFETTLKMIVAMVESEKSVYSNDKYGNYMFYNISQEKLLEIMKETNNQGYYVAPCMFTADNQMIITGELAGLEKMGWNVLKSGGLGVHIPYSPPAHSSMMDRVRDLFKQKFMDVNDFTDPVIPNMCNNTALPLLHGEQIKESLTEQYVLPVRWTDILHLLKQEGIEQLDIIGPGKFLVKSMEYTDVSFDIKSYLEIKDFQLARS
ncbi:[acyl-carrier-protein] S-malonyltransferase [Cytobacillus horneckiae]|uniref:[acyl-carrier-protein] S-malonyltransferase n=2 Tax=Cytobacillus horneckiae TaxID=549687 RepID=A0A2N0ZGD3_9BACI|nr:ACP S-malonyltransferase [Cytobacillus horneckiae]MBN6886068.1 ACP S-malonyltransferase [Cytobacillus horneckiae]MCM3176372.1 ACP S-malonyltransferase [Cytobacillus horneckiae]PKG28556.1 ACP S-malonyltransferase [Cytobacillus horneckiae]